MLFVFVVNQAGCGPLFVDSFAAVKQNVRLKFLEGFPSGQRGQTVNLLFRLRWFESTSLHHIVRE
jgi:hypothetical protein